MVGVGGFGLEKIQDGSGLTWRHFEGLNLGTTCSLRNPYITCGPCIRRPGSPDPQALASTLHHMKLCTGGTAQASSAQALPADSADLPQYMASVLGPDTGVS